MTEHQNDTKAKQWGITTILAIIILLWGLYNVLFNRGKDELVVYCTHDAVYAESVIKAFSREYGIPVSVKFDTEATKSLGLVELLKQEREHPRCDVFWNNELLGMISLKEAGVLQPYEGKNHSRIPESFRDPDRCWAGFGARMRVYIVNTEKYDQTKEPSTVLEQTPGQFAVAKPLYGTTLTHFCVLWDVMGEKKLKQWFSDIREKGVRILNGNSAVKNAVAAGSLTAGFTDTDDFFSAYDEKKPVQLHPVRVGDGKTICIPNTVALIKGSQREGRAKLLIDYLLSEKAETALANSGSRQIPLGPVDEKKIPEEIRQLKAWAEDSYPLSGLEKIYSDCVQWLKKEYAK